MLTLTNCKICRSESNQFISLFCGMDRFHEVDGTFTVMQCASCGIVFLNPQPTFDEIRKYYPDDYYSYHTVETSTTLSRFLDQIKNIFYKRGFPISKGMRILDIGCGNGEKVSKYLQLGAECYGVEIDKRAVDVARSKGVKAYHGDLFVHKFDEKFFDVIIMDNVFEHIAEPDVLMLKVKNILKDEGVFIVTVPNKSSFTRLLFGKYWIGYDVPRHFYSYSPRSLSTLAYMSGLRVEKTRYVQNGYQCIASLRMVLRSLSKSWKMPSERSFLFENPIIIFITFVLFFPLNIIHYGDTVKLFLRKKND